LSTIFDNGGLQYFRYELLTLQNGSYKHADWLDNYVEKGSINVNTTRDINAGASFTIKNYDDINFLKDLIKPWLYFEPNDTTYQIPLGHYMLLSPDKNYSNNVITRNIKGFDLLKALDQKKTIVSNSFEEGSNVVETIEGLLDGVGTWVVHQIEPNDATLPENISYELGKSTLFIVNSLLNMINYYPLFCTGNGVYKGIPWSSTPNVIHTFENNEFSLLEDNIDIDEDKTNIYNKAVVITNRADSETDTFYATWTFEDEGLADHPFSITSTGYIIPEIFNSEAVSQDYVDLRARRELRKMLEIEEAITYNHAFVSKLNDGLPWQGDAFRFKHSDLNINEVYRIVSQDYSLQTGVNVKSTIRRVKYTDE
jgi:hypothetical protein